MKSLLPFFLLLAFFSLVSCSSKKENGTFTVYTTPTDSVVEIEQVIAIDSFAVILTDCYISESILNFTYRPNQLDTSVYSEYAYVLNKHNISQQQLLDNVNYYSAEEERRMQLYNLVTNMLDSIILKVSEE